MKKPAILAFVFAIFPGIALASGGGCPFCHGKVVQYCYVEITPDQPLYGEEITLNVTLRYLRDITPIDKGTEVTFEFYNDKRNLTEEIVETDSRGIARYTPGIVGYHLIKTCGKSILIYVNSTCGDGVCGGGETRSTCADDCGNCGDGICDSNEDVNCPDCAVCGDKVCSPGESRAECLKDCIFCGDDICDYLENHGSCPDDCLSGEADGYCDGKNDSFCDPDCNETNDLDCEMEKKAAETPPPKRLLPEVKKDNWPLVITIIASVCAIAFAVAIVEKKRLHGKKTGIMWPKKSTPVAKESSKEQA